MSLRVSAGKLSPADKQRPLSKKIVLACSPTSSPSPASGKAHHISLGTSLSSESSRVIFTPVVKLLKKWQSLLGLATSLPRPLLPHDLSTSSSPAHLTALCSALTRRGTAFRVPGLRVLLSVHSIPVTTWASSTESGSLLYPACQRRTVIE